MDKHAQLCMQIWRLMNTARDAMEPAVKRISELSDRWVEMELSPETIVEDWSNWYG